MAQEPDFIPVGGGGEPDFIPIGGAAQSHDLAPPDAVKQAQGVIKGLPARIDKQSDVLTNIRQGYQGGGVGSHLSEEGVIREGSGPAVKTMTEMGVGGLAGAAVGGTGLAAGVGRALATGAGAAAGNVAGQAVTTGKVDPEEALRTGAGYTAGEGLGAMAGKTFSKIASKMDPLGDASLTRINDMLGVSSKGVRVGDAATSADKFITNPARGVVNAGLDEKALGKMDPLTRHRAVVAARESAGKKLDSVLAQASSSGKTVDITQPIQDTINSITDPRIRMKSVEEVDRILDSHGLANRPLNSLTPTEVRAVQRDLDDFAKFESINDVRSFKGVATQLRRGLSSATRKVVPESAPWDQQYGDLKAATKATENTVRKSASTVPKKAPPSEFKKWVKRTIIGGTLYEGYKALTE